MPTIRREFGDLYVRGLGDGDETVILLHEYFGTYQSWAAQTAELARHFRVLVPDLRGHGRSPVPRNARISVRDTAGDVAAIRETYDLGRCHLVGCSLGAVVALFLANNQPEWIQSITISSVPSLNSTEAVAYARQYIDHVFPRIETTLERSHGDGETGYMRNVLLRNFAEDLEERPDDHLEATEGIERLHAPALVISGEEDPVFGHRAALAAAERMPNRSFAALPACGHLVHQDLPGVFNYLVLDHVLRSSRKAAPEAG